jgi:hypothetical protein
LRKKLWLILTLILGLIIAAWFLVYYLKTLNNRTPLPMPGNRQKANYSYYRIIDENTGELLTYISSTPVNKGDEYITGKNRRYIITRLKGNTAYAKYIGPAK